MAIFYSQESAYLYSTIFSTTENQKIISDNKGQIALYNFTLYPAVSIILNMIAQNVPF